jgi:hypothetical protein
MQVLLFSRSSAASAAAGAVSTSLSGGVLNVNTGLGGAARLYLRVPRPTTNVGGSALRDFKAIEISVGTSAGGFQVIPALDFSASAPVKGALEFRLNELITGTTYYVRSRAINSVGNRSADSPEFSAVAAIYSAPTGPYSDINSTQTISVSGNYQLGSSFSGTITINASGVYLYGNGKTLSHNGADGIVLAAGVSDVRVDGINFSRTTTGHHVRINGNLGSTVTVCQISNNTGMTVLGSNAAGVYSPGYDLGGARVYGNTVTITSTVGTSSETSLVSSSINYRAYGNVVTNTGCAGRAGFIGDSVGFEAWENTWSAADSYQPFFFSTDVRSPTDVYIHDNRISVGTNCDTYRSINLDSRLGLASGDYMPLVSWNTFSITPTGTTSGPQIRVRGTVGPAIIGYNTFDMGGGSTDVWAISFGDDQDGGSALSEPYGGYMYNNTITNYGTTKPFLSYGGDAWQNTLYTWNNVWGGQEGGPSGNWSANSDTFANGAVKTGTPTWNGYNLTVGGSNPFTVQGSWTGYNPASDTPSAPGTITAVIGVP